MNEKMEPTKPTQSKPTEPKVDTGTIPNATITNTAAKIYPNITIKLDNPCHIHFVIQNTAEESPRIVYDQKISLSRGTIYKLPITSNLDLQKYNTVKHVSKFASVLRVLDVVDGIVIIEPLVHGIILNNGDTIAVLI